MNSRRFQTAVIHAFCAMLTTVFLVGCVRRTPEIRENMSMAEVEQALGKPDRIETEKGHLTATEETPTVIKWYYQRFKVLDSGQQYGTPGYINFVPLRFTQYSRDTERADSIARKYGEQSDAFRTCSYIGSFHWHKEPKDAFAGIGFVPLKTLTQQNAQ